MKLIRIEKEVTEIIQSKQNHRFKLLQYVKVLNILLNYLKKFKTSKETSHLETKLNHKIQQLLFLMSKSRKQKKIF